MSAAAPIEPTGGDRAAAPLRLRPWFYAFGAWMVGLSLVAHFSLHMTGAQSGVALAVWLLAVYALYLSLCCVFFPAPTTWIVMLCASDAMADAAGVAEHRVARLVVVATLGALATGMANLNEYHLVTALMRLKKLSRIREARSVTTAVRWFESSPFLVLLAVSLLPIPVDVVRWLAIWDRYPRGRFFLAYFIGRWGRYAVWAAFAMSLSLKFWHILAVQVALLLAAAARVAPRIVRQVRAAPRPVAAVAVAAYDPARSIS